MVPPGHPAPRKQSDARDHPQGRDVGYPTQRGGEAGFDQRYGDEHQESRASYRSSGDDGQRRFDNDGASSRRPPENSEPFDDGFGPFKRLANPSQGYPSQYQPNPTSAPSPMTSATSKVVVPIQRSASPSSEPEGKRFRRSRWGDDEGD